MESHSKTRYQLAMSIRATIIALGQRAEGIADIEGQRVFVPLTLPGEVVEIEVDGDRGTLVSIVEPSPHRVIPFCPHFGACGGCQTQHMDQPSYREFKTGLLETSLRFAGIDTPISQFIDAQGTGRRRATLHARREGAGYMRARSHEVEDLDRCPILVEGLARAPDIARTVHRLIGEADVSLTATLSGLDVAVRTEKSRASAKKLEPLMQRFGLARLALNGEMLLQAQPPMVPIGRKARVELPIGSFLQATDAAQTILSDYVAAAVKDAKRVADLFCGVGPFALGIAERSRVYAADSDRPGIVALDKARRLAKGLKEIKAQFRDLFREPLTRFELNDYDAIVLDPPRAGAEAQVREVAASKVQTVVMIACDAKTFARDAAILLRGGYQITDLRAVDQFVHSTHIEIASTLKR